MHKILFEDASRLDLLPLTFTRPLFDLRFGIFTFFERWKEALQEELYAYASGYLSDHFSKLPPTNEPILWINSKFLPNQDLLAEIKNLGPNVFLKNGQEEIIAACFSISQLPGAFEGNRQVPDRA